MTEGSGGRSSDVGACLPERHKASYNMETKTMQVSGKPMLIHAKARQPRRASAATIKH